MVSAAAQTKVARLAATRARAPSAVAQQGRASAPSKGIREEARFPRQSYSASPCAACQAVEGLAHLEEKEPKMMSHQDVERDAESTTMGIRRSRWSPRRTARSPSQEAITTATALRRVISSKREQHARHRYPQGRARDRARELRNGCARLNAKITSAMPISMVAGILISVSTSQRILRRLMSE